ncbi:MAG: glycosyltransferase family 9 protein [Chitinophagaceae bacterium]|nr:glycosyltransferase family 9 protein [Chitinophagaceae bacterium]
MILQKAIPWKPCRNLLCIRADNMGDLIMTTPALRALKQSFDGRITILTSSMGKLVAPFIPEVDDIMIADLPWVSHKGSCDENGIMELAATIREKGFDGVVIFTVYSQSALPAALLTCMAGIPQRLAYCRENPYGLLTHWVPDKEPYSFTQHQVQRDIGLVHCIGATAISDHLYLEVGEQDKERLYAKLKQAGMDTDKPFMIFHPGVSEEKRIYPSRLWIRVGQLIGENMQLLITGGLNERALTCAIAKGIGPQAFDMGGKLDLGELIAVVDAAQLVVAVNTGTIHIAAARQTPVVVLYANTNPQHIPWKVPSTILPFSVSELLKSKNEIIHWVDQLLYRDFVPFPEPEAVAMAIRELYRATNINRHEHC